jgi:hypothetical protein
MGIEPTGRAVHARPDDFEDRGHHQVCKHFLDSTVKTRPGELGDHQANSKPVSRRTRSAKSPSRPPITSQRSARRNSMSP